MNNNLSLNMNTEDFTGFLAHYNDGKKIYEREDYFSDRIKKKCSTNWSEIDTTKLSSLELLWKGRTKIRIDKVPTSMSFNSNKELSPTDWFFSQKGYFDMKSRKIIVVARNIGYRDNGIIHIASVIENSGIVRIYDRAG